MRNLCPHDISIVTEDDESGTSSKSVLGTMLLFGTGPDSSFSESMSEGKDDNTENDSDPTGGDEEDPMSECLLLWRHTCQKQVLPSCHVCDQEISGECSERVDLPPRLKWQCTCFACRISLKKKHGWWRQENI